MISPASSVRRTLAAALTSAVPCAEATENPTSRLHPNGLALSGPHKSYSFVLCGFILGRTFTLLTQIRYEYY